MRLFQCPVPGCTHVAEHITNWHTTFHHGMTKQQVVEAYGAPVAMREDPQKLVENTKSNFKETTAPQARYDRFKNFRSNFVSGHKGGSR